MLLIADAVNELSLFERLLVEGNDDQTDDGEGAVLSDGTIGPRFLYLSSSSSKDTSMAEWSNVRTVLSPAS